MKTLVRIKKAPTIILLTYMDVNVPLFVHRGVSWICVCCSYSLVSVSFFYLCLHSFSFTQSHPVSPIRLITHLLMHFLSGMLELPHIFFVFPSPVWHYLSTKRWPLNSLISFHCLPLPSLSTFLARSWLEKCAAVFGDSLVNYCSYVSLWLTARVEILLCCLTVAECGDGLQLHAGLYLEKPCQHEREANSSYFSPVTFSAPRSKVKTIWTPGRIYPAKEPNGQLTIQSNNNASSLNGIL